MTYVFDYISPELRSMIEPATLQSHRFEKKLDYKVYKNAYVAPYYDWDSSIGCVIDANGKVIIDSECLEWKENENCYQLEHAVKEKKKVIYLGFLLTVFGHSFTDDLRKLWFLGTEEGKTLIANGWELVYTTSWNRVLPSYIFEIFNLAGYDISNARQITDIVEFDEVCIPDNSVIATDCGRMFSAEYENAIDCIKKKVTLKRKAGGKLYFTRSKFTKDSKREVEEKRIERIFSKLGYSIVSPEDYSIVEQIQMVQNCEFFAATEGSVAHMSLFCDPGTKVVLINKANYLNFHQVMINEFADLNVTYIEAHHSIKADAQCPWWGPFYLCINKYLERFVGRSIPHLPYWLLPSYWEYSRNLLYRGYNRTRKLLRKLFK